MTKEEIKTLIDSGIQKVSNSRVGSYLSCPCKHYFGYVMGLRSKKPARPLSFGGDFHKLLEHRSDKAALKEAVSTIRTTYNKAPLSTQTELGETYLDDLKVVFQDYQKVYKNAQLPVETEHEFLVPMGEFKGKPIYFHGIIDEIYDGLLLGEHKTFNQRPDMSILAMNMQVCLYAKAWEIETGEKLQRVRWDYIKSVQAKYPIWLEKSSRFSEAANEGITQYSWERACKARGITLGEIIHKGTNYAQNISNFFFRCDMDIVPNMVDTVWDDFTATVMDLFTRGDTNKVKNISKDCSWCGYRPICYAEFTGADTAYIIKKDYEVKPK